MKAHCVARTPALHRHAARCALAGPELVPLRYPPFHIHHSPLLGCWDDVFGFVDDVHREAVPRLVRERILELNSPVRRAALADRRHDCDGEFVQYALKQVLRELG